jgi:hypothetical protein
MTAATISSGSALAKTKFANTALQGFLEKNPLAPIFAPVGMDSPIVTVKTKSGEGMSHQFAFTGDGSMDSWRAGDIQVEGQGEALVFGVDTLTYQRDRTATRIDNLTEAQLRTGINLSETAKNQLIRKGSARVGFQLLKAMCDATVGRTVNRWLYGVTQANYNATHATALATVDSTNDKMSLAIIDELVMMAKTQTSGSNYMQPAAVKRQDGTVAYKWICLLHAKAARDLKQSSAYLNQVLNRDKPAFNVINGGQFLGEWNDTLIYEVPAFFKPTTANPHPMIATTAGTAGIDVAINLFFGSNAAAMGVGDVVLFDDPSLNAMKTTADTDGAVRLTITTKVGDHGGNAEMAATMVPAYKKLVDSSSGTAEAAGIINFCTSAL